MSKLATLLAFLMTLLLMSCGGSGDPSTDPDSSGGSSSVNKAQKIAESLVGLESLSTPMEEFGVPAGHRASTDADDFSEKGYHVRIFPKSGSKIRKGSEILVTVWMDKENAGKRSEFEVEWRGFEKFKRRENKFTISDQADTWSFSSKGSPELIALSKTQWLTTKGQLGAASQIAVFPLMEKPRVSIIVYFSEKDNHHFVAKTFTYEVID